MKNKTSLALTILFAVILIIEYTFLYKFPHWTFTKTNLVIANHLLFYFSIFGFIIALTFLFNAPTLFKILFGVLLTLFLGIFSITEIRPIDTTTKPIDKELLWINIEGKKMIVRQRTNAKTNSEILDTVLVKDFGIFRRIYSQ